MAKQQYLVYEPRFNYSNKVLVGKHWYEERQKYIFNKYLHRTTNDVDFVEKGPYTVDAEEYFRNKYASERGKFREISDENVKNNFVSTYKISFEILPKTKGFEKRIYSRGLHTYKPQQDFNKQYGNMNCGVGAKRCARLKDERLKYKWIPTSRFDYLKPNLKDYTYSRRAIPREFSSTLCNTNLQNIHLALRNKQISLVPDYIPEFPRRPYPHFYF